MARWTLVLLALAGCNPVVHVPSSLPSAAGRTGVRLGAEGNVTAGQVGLRLDASPTDAVTVFGRVGRASGGEDGTPPYAHVGGAGGVVLQAPLGDEILADLGVAVGSDRVRAEGRTRVAGGEIERAAFDAEVRHVGVHLGLFGRGLLGTEQRFVVGPALRLTHLVVGTPRRRDGGTPLEDGRAFLVEPVLRGRLGGGRWDAEVQGGLVVPLQSDLGDRYDVAPFLLSARLGVRLF